MLIAVLQTSNLVIIRGMRTSAAERTVWHEWINTGIAGVALLASGAAAVFAWQANQAKKEALSIVPQLTGACRTEYHGNADGGQIGLCWSVTLANDSENRLSIVDYRVFSVEEGGLAWFGGFQNLETEDGKPLSVPLNLDGGEARKVIVRAGFPVPAAVAHVIGQMREFKSLALGSVSIGALQHVLAAAGLDYVGNTVQPIISDGKVSGWAYPSSLKRATAVLHIETGRGSVFNGNMSYPPIIP
jgi:hypothetical protein